MGGRQGRQWLAGAVGLALLLQLLFSPSPAEALSWRLPGRRADAPARLANDLAGPTLREVPPPAWVQQARAALEERDPRVRILAPADGDLLPDGPWTLRLQVSDWPLVDAGPLGLGPHLVVQLDGEPPRPTVDAEVRMPPLSPGSHLLTVYAAKPWGEAHKSPLALQQIRLHRLAANPATLPAPGTPQLIPVSPAGLAADPPLPLDWLLLDAPLQGLRGDASGWRLRLTLNGESVLVDQQIPLWLQGWKPGGNALLLELLDGRGEPLNPPFNSLLREVIVPASGTSGSTRALSAQRTDLEIAVLLGDQPASALIPPEAPSPTPPPPSAPAPSALAPSAPAEAEGEGTPVSVPQQAEASPVASLAPGLESTAPSAPPLPSGPATTVPAEGPAPIAAGSGPSPGPAETGAGAAEAPPAPVSPPAPRVPPSPNVPPAAAAPNLAAQAPTAPDGAPPQALAPPPESLLPPPESLVPPPQAPTTAAPSPPAPPPDGTLKRPAKPNPFDRLRERLGR